MGFHGPTLRPFGIVGGYPSAGLGDSGRCKQQIAIRFKNLRLCKVKTSMRTKQGLSWPEFNRLQYVIFQNIFTRLESAVSVFASDSASD